MAELNVENIAEEIRKGRAITQEATTAAIAKIEEDRKEKLTLAAKREILDSEFTQKLALLKLQRNRAEEVPTKEKLKTMTTIATELKAGSLTVETVKEKREAAEKEFNKAYNAIVDEYEQLENQLRSQYNNYRW